MRKLATIGLGLVAIAAIFWVIIGSGGFKPHSETLTFTRSVDSDEGVQLDPSIVISKEGVRLSDVFSPERMATYGGYNDSGLYGGGLTVNFVWEGIDRKESPFTIEGYKAGDEQNQNNDLRNELVLQRKAEFAKIVEGFTAPVGIKRAFGVALDTTEGVTPALAKRIRQIIDETGAIKLGADKKNTVVLNLYNITESSYQGDRERPNLGSQDELKSGLEWLLKERTRENNSSVLRGLIAILQEMSGYMDSHPVLHVITDGLENLPELSVYRDRTLLDEANWAKLDQIADLSKLQLKGLDIHLHHLPNSSASMMEKGLKYLADRLTKAGAKVTIQPF